MTIHDSFDKGRCMDISKISHLEHKMSNVDLLLFILPREQNSGILLPYSISNADRGEIYKIKRDQQDTHLALITARFSELIEKHDFFFANAQKVLYSGLAHVEGEGTVDFIIAQAGDGTFLILEIIDGKTVTSMETEKISNYRYTQNIE